MKYTFKGKTYEIIGDRKEQLLRDFEYCEEIRDWATINNRIINGLKWNWLKELQ